MNTVNINSFLQFGYFLDYKNPDYTIDFSGTDKSRYEHTPEAELIDTGITLWKKAIEKQFNTHEKHVVPLSGGIDSRAILASLLELTDASNIHTYTFGTPGTLDYEIGNRIARVAGTKHTPCNLMEYAYDLNELIDISKRVDHQTLMFLSPRIAVLDDMFGDWNVWSGIIIDVFFGRHTHTQKANAWEQAILNSFKENTYTKSVNIVNVPEENYFKHIDYDPRVKGTLVLEHVIDLMNRQVKFVAPIVLMKGYKYKLLFTDKALTDFALSINNCLNEDQYFYKEMFLKAYPHLFSFPVKSNCGLPLSAGRFQVYRRRMLNKFKRTTNTLFPLFINPDINYLDFDEAIRNKADLNKIIYECIMDLKQKHIVDWIDIESIWNRHIGGKANHSDALLTLASLEIHLKAGKTMP